jgi:hypothetical protein
MGEVNIEVWFPAPPLVFGIFLGAFALWLVYKAAKFIISIWTGA